MDQDIMVSWIEAGTIQIPVLLIQKYRNLGLDEKELSLLLQIIAYKEKGNDFPTPEQIAEKMTITHNECSSILRKLVQHEMIKIEQQSDKGLGFDQYSLTPLWYKLAEEMIKERKHENFGNILEEEQNLFTIFENEFGRPLSPMECESLAMWIDQDGQEPTLIKAALKEAVMSNTLNFRYIDRILFEWKKNGIQTVEQAKIHSSKFRQKTKASKPTHSTSKTMPVYNWLEQ
ncbi:DnaD domain-containing protein [Lederbergia galactosidilytica]|uniref:DNA replication protein DnaD n=1 Tax=Lederbergia galactosidilytica TaxID=217031 RepID=A0A177ZPW0_9BACI|nr:DnaD domain-containing protein [Lederbergia galactosidilytica]KRG12484.1 DNA replication protein DnaD [Virgibacillus soli]MBP1914604.1 DNA replication protein [Lederbergia galactosidilytica]OAK69804.1 DNA replication protein DnaD [Lederbergia galactosidilytica]